MEHGKKLTPKQRRFAEEYLLDLNATRAAIRAGYSQRTAGQIGDELLKKPEIAAAVAATMKERGERNRLDADKVLNELIRLAFFDAGKAFNDDGSMKPLSKMDEDTRRAIIGLDVVAIEQDGVSVSTVKKVRFADKKSALDTLAKHLGLLTDRLKISGDQQNPIQLMIQAVQGNVLRPVPHRSIMPTTIDGENDFQHRN